MLFISFEAMLLVCSVMAGCLTLALLDISRREAFLPISVLGFSGVLLMRRTFGFVVSNVQFLSFFFKYNHYGGYYVIAVVWMLTARTYFDITLLLRSTMLSKSTELYVIPYIYIITTIIRVILKSKSHFVTPIDKGFRSK